jgi:hypothetical protein
LHGYDAQRPHRRAIRLGGYDYTQEGVYFVTVCVEHRACLLGAVQAGEARPNAAGRMVQAVWDDLALRYPGVETGAFVVMPNHVHGVVVLNGVAPQDSRAPTGGRPYAADGVSDPEPTGRRPYAAD